jgi:2-polyprenyl-3-methyl-5-hydroxy-6-metoxy-1,4-benzoquinol methylase
MKKYFDKTHHRLVMTGQAADNTFWDEHWKIDEQKFVKILKNTKHRFVLGKTGKYLFPGAKILEGGCGWGSIVYALHHHGYEAYGIDYAKDTVENIKHHAPELKVQVGDIRQLPFPESSFDGYWSLGVIEHFYDGYDDIAREMLRVLKPNGYLFLTVPTMSILRKLKARLGLYPQMNNEDRHASDFYQFVFDPKDVTANLERFGFKLIKTEPCDGVKGLKDEVAISKRCLQYVYDSRKFPLKVLRKILDMMLKCFSNHMCLFVMKKNV